MFTLENELRPYAWGSTTAIAELLGRTPSGGPEAELWLGAHADSPSRVNGRGLNELIAENPAALLGEASVAAYGERLPFLMKVLAAGQALSLQVHPSLAQAAEGFARENAEGVPQEASFRNYKDDNHKPEMILALTPFRALCGFRPVTESRAIFAALATELPADSVVADVVAALAAETPLRAAVEYLLGSADREAVARTTATLAGWAGALPSGLSSFAFAFEVAAGLTEQYPGDPGVLISLLLNSFELEPGESVYLPAGNVHAYISGLGIEVMANSDNVLRGGLTPKHVDVPELVKTIDFRSLPVPELHAVQTSLGESVFAPPFGEFALQELVLGADAEATASVYQDGAAILLVVDGALRLDSPQGELVVERGQSVFLPANEAPVTAHAHGSAGARAFVATTGLAQLGGGGSADVADHGSAGGADD